MIPVRIRISIFLGINVASGSSPSRPTPEFTDPMFVTPGLDPG